MRITIPTPNPPSNTTKRQKPPHKPPQNPWVIPEGDYRAVLKQAKLHEGKIRLVFTVTVPGCPFPCLAGKNYPNDLSTGSALRNDLFSWRGHDLTPEEDQAWSIEPADIRIVHIENARYENPFVCVKAIYPAGTLIK